MSDLQSWGSRERLAPEILEILQKKGFSTVEDIQHVEPSDIKEYFYETNLLNMAQFLALKRAITRLHSGSVTTSSTGGAVLAPSFPSPPPTSSFDSGAPADPANVLPGRLWEEERKVQATPYCLQPQFFQHNPSQHGLLSYPKEQQAEETAQVFGAMCLHAMPQPHYRMGIGGGDVERWASEGNEGFRFLLLGKTGSGKSTTGNTIFDEDLFPTSATFCSITKNCDRKVSYKRGIKIEIIDSPGLYDTHKTQEEICLTIVQSVAGMHPGPHAILYVMSLGRYTAEEFGAYMRLKALFDESICKYMIVIITGGDMLELQGKTIESLMNQEIPKQLKQVLTECNNRFILFNNFAQNRHPQVERLFLMVREMVTMQGGLPYTCPKYSQIGQGMEEEVARRLHEVEKRDLKRQKYVQQLEQQTLQAEEAAKVMEEQFQKNELERQRQAAEEASKRQLLEEKLQAESRKQEERLRQHQQEMERLRMEKEEQERRLKEKEHEMSEREKQRAAEDAERRAQQERELTALMKEQQAMMEENAKQRQLMEEERQEAIREMEQQRQRDREELERREEEREMLWRKRVQEEAEADRRRKEQYEREMEQLKNRVVANDQSTFWGAFENADKVFSHCLRLVSLVTDLADILRSFHTRNSPRNDDEDDDSVDADNKPKSDDDEKETI